MAAETSPVDTCPARAHNSRAALPVRARRSERGADARLLEFQHVQDFNGAVPDVQQPIGVEVEPLIVAAREELEYNTSPVGDVDRLVIVEVGRPLIIGLVVVDGVIGAGVEGVGADEQLDSVAEPERVA